LLDFPFSDATGSKVRPAIVVQGDAQNRRLNATIVTLVTKTTKWISREPTQFFIEINSPEGRAAGLHFDSAIACTNLYTVHEDFIRYRIGRLPSALTATLDACLKAALGIV
ncbi:MAG TPA: type II toxin-antitoxin system PemK/MazF family toxin, partial [Pirellulales bacterium]